MRGYFDAAKGQFVEHSIRALSATYFSLFGIFDRAGVLDNLSAVDTYQFYEKSSGNRVSIDRTGSISPSTMIEMIRTFDLAPKDMVDSFLLMFMPMTESPKLPSGKASKSYCFDRPTSQVVDKVLEVLRARGVKIITDTRLVAIRKADQFIHVTTGNDAVDDVVFDAAILAIPHEVMWKLALLEADADLSDEWSFGVQVPFRSRS